MANQPVQVWKRSTGDWSLLATPTTDSAGGFVVSDSPDATTTYTLRVPAGPVYRQAVSDDVSIEVGPGPYAARTPASLSVAAQSTSADVSWTPPTDDGGSAVTGYQVAIRDPRTGGNVGLEHAVAGSDRSLHVTGLDPDTAYRAVVFTRNAVGLGPPATTDFRTSPVTAPPAPSGVTASPGDRSAVVRWQPPAGDGGSPVDGYVVTPYAGSAAQPSQRFNSTATSQTVTGLTDGTAYTFAVAAHNSAGTGASSPPSDAVTPTTPPTASTATLSGPAARTTTYGTTVPLSGTANPGAVVAVWFQQGGSGAYVQRRTVTARPDGSWSTSYVATDDQRVYATAGSARSATATVQVTPTIAGGLSHVVPRNSTYTITGAGIPGRVLTVHFHKAGTASTDYSILRTVTVDSNGRWSRPYVATVDYRFFATLPNRQASPTVLVQTR